MASNYYGINLNGSIESAVVGTSTNSTDIELRVDTSKITNKEQIFEAIENLEGALLRFAFP